METAAFRETCALPFAIVPTTPYKLPNQAEGQLPFITVTVLCVSMWGDGDQVSKKAKYFLCP